MSVQRTLSIIKPDAVGRGLIGKIIARFESEGLWMAGAQLLQMSAEQAGAFYVEHRERAFFQSLLDFMTSGPVLVLVLEGEDAIAHNREIMGATNPAEAAPGTLRHEYAESVEHNAVHGSDSSASAEREIAFFFTDELLVRRC